MYPGTHAQTQPGKLAVIRPATGESMTYADLDARSNRLAQLLRANGVGRGSRIAIFSENRLEFFDAIWAAMRSGLYLVSVNTHLTATEAAYIVADSDASALIASANLPQSPELGRLATDCTIKLAVGAPIEGFAEYADALAAHPAEPIADEALGTFMAYSSGTTGRPKGILRDLPASPVEQGSPKLDFLADLFGYDADTVYLSTAPIYHGAPIGHAAAVIQRGGTVVMMDRFDAETALGLIERYRITHGQFVPTMFVRLLKLPPEVRNAFDTSSLKMAIHAAAPCPIEVKRQMIAWWGPVLEEYYASTEGLGMTTIHSAEWLERPGSVGRGRNKIFHICDDAGNELPAGQAGHIFAESPGDTFAYHKDPQKSAESRHPTRPDWIGIGDIGYLDEDGYLYLTDRKAFMIISGGVNIYPQQIEAVLALYPGIDDVAVIGVPNADLGEEVKAVVQPAAGAASSDALARDIMAYVQARLGRQLTPRSVDFVDELPRLPTGKLAKNMLREKYWGPGVGAAGQIARG